MVACLVACLAVLIGAPACSLETGPISGPRNNGLSGEDAGGAGRDDDPARDASTASPTTPVDVGGSGDGGLAADGGDAGPAGDGDGDGDGDRDGDGDGDGDGDSTPACTSAANERCNGIDDDCDGEVDEQDPEAGANCDTGEDGVCAAGAKTCIDGALSCVQQLEAAEETCNGLDDDCDGTTDDGSAGGGGSCQTGGKGRCAAGTLTCQSASLHCVQNDAAVDEICGNAVDEDCDGALDNGCTCSSGKANCDLNWASGAGGCECATEGCCGAACETKHDNGQGQNFYDCEPLGTLGADQALKACVAFTGDDDLCVDLGKTCVGAGTPSGMLCGTPSSGADCTCWAYEGPRRGRSYNDPESTECVCPRPGDPAWM